MLACYCLQGKQLASGVIDRSTNQSHYNVCGINTTPCARLLLRHPLAQRIPTEPCECSVRLPIVLRQSASDFIRMSGSLPHIQKQSRRSQLILPRKSYMRDSPVSVSAPLRKLNAVCFVPLKIFLNYARGTIFLNIEISEYRAFGTLGRLPVILPYHHVCRL